MIERSAYDPRAVDPYAASDRWRKPSFLPPVGRGTVFVGHRCGFASRRFSPQEVVATIRSPFERTTRLLPPKSPPPEPAQDETLFRVLRTLEANPRTSQRELAGSMGMSLGKANYCLKALLDKGLIKMQSFRNSRNKLAYAYFLTPTGVAAKASLTLRFLQQKIAEYEALKAEIEQLENEAGE